MLGIFDQIQRDHGHESLRYQSLPDRPARHFVGLRGQLCLILPAGECSSLRQQKGRSSLEQDKRYSSPKLQLSGQTMGTESRQGSYLLLQLSTHRLSR